MKFRDPNVDLIRALAILLVLIHHIGQFLPLLSDTAHRYTGLGAYGVDMFFVLSGWLIGGLYWQEKKETGNVRLFRFWLRRWLRTIPPYLVALLVSYTGVYFSRNEPFQWEYLLFLQNYEARVPYFLISWSLCVEEHFYLFMPLALMFVIRLRIPLTILLPASIAIALFIRFIDPYAMPNEPFGYASTASHLNFAGLGIGLYFSFLSKFHEQQWRLMQKLCRTLAVPMLFIFLIIPFLSDGQKYYIGNSYAALISGVLLATLTSLPSLRIATFRPTYYLALTSYSIYLSHSIVLQACIAFTDKYKLIRELMFPTWFVAILAAGMAMYFFIEKPTFYLRDRIAKSQ